MLVAYQIYNWRRAIDSTSRFGEMKQLKVSILYLPSQCPVVESTIAQCHELVCGHGDSQIIDLHSLSVDYNGV